MANLRFDERDPSYHFSPKDRIRLRGKGPLAGQVGVVLRYRGLNKFQVELPDGRIVSASHNEMRPLPPEGSPEESNAGSL